MLRRLLLSLQALSLPILLLGHAGCTASSPDVLTRRQPYRDSDYAPYRGTGTAELSGQALAKDREGGAIYAADDSVYLFPATPYTDEWWERTMIEGRYLTDPDPRSLAFMRIVVADELGRFRFRSLPEGEYFVVCIMTWRAGEEGSPLQVANLGTRVHLARGEAASVALQPISRHRALIDPPAPESGE